MTTLFIIFSIMGTGGQISVLSEQHFEAPGIEARPFLNRTWLLTGAILCAGRAYAILEQFFRSCASAMGLGDTAQYELMNPTIDKNLTMFCAH